MQLPVLSRRGQARPYGGIPRINWAHPLARGLALYTYDAGGVIVDLVNGGLGSLAAGTASVGSYQFGSGLKFPGAGGTDARLILAQSAAAKTIGATLPYSVAVGTFYTGAAQFPAFVACTSDVTNNNDTGAAFATSGSATVMQYLWNNGAAAADYTTAIATNTFQTWVMVPTAATTATLYANGVLDKNVTAISSTTYGMPNGGHVIYDEGISTGAEAPGGISGFIPFFACWTRQLTAADALQLHQDPYCFLIYQEDAMFSMMVGVTAAAAYTPYNPWPQAAPVLAT